MGGELFVFRDGVFFIFIFYVLGKVIGFFSSLGIFLVLFIGFHFFLLFLSFWKSYLHTRGSLNLLACFQTLGFIIYWLVLGEGD